jgi:hypothetical protein
VRRFSTAVDALTRWEQRRSGRCLGVLRSRTKFEVWRVIDTLHLRNGRRDPPNPQGEREPSRCSWEPSSDVHVDQSFGVDFSELTLQQGQHRRAQRTGSASLFTDALHQSGTIVATVIGDSLLISVFGRGTALDGSQTSK